MKKLIFILIFNSPIAFAALGDRETSTASDRKFSVSSLYSIHELSDPHINIREYTANGVVFAVSWSGPVRPDLTKLLGNYHQEYQFKFQQLKKIKGQRSQSLVESKNLIVRQFGHMRWMQGIAYVPSLLPTGVSPNEIK